MRLVNILVIAALILAASFVYKIKFDSTLQAERVANLRGELRRERNAIAVLRAEWARLDTPGRIQGLPTATWRCSPSSRLNSTNWNVCPKDHPPAEPPAGKDPIGAMLSAPPRHNRQRAATPTAVTSWRDRATHRKSLAARSTLAPLRTRCRSQREGKGPAWPCHRCFRRHLRGDRRAPRYVCNGDRGSRGPAQHDSRMRSLPRVPTSSTATAKFSRPT
jgi:hypothetical protein